MNSGQMKAVGTVKVLIREWSKYRQTICKMMLKIDIELFMPYFKSSCKREYPNNTQSNLSIPLAIR